MQHLEFGIDFLIHFDSRKLHDQFPSHSSLSQMPVHNFYYHTFTDHHLSHFSSSTPGSKLTCSTNRPHYRQRTSITDSQTINRISRAYQFLLWFLFVFTTDRCRRHIIIGLSGRPCVRVSMHPSIHLHIS